MPEAGSGLQAGRPQMPAGYGILDAASGAGLMPWGMIEEQLAASRNYWVASTRPDGRPHAVPVWGVWLDGAVCFSTDARSRKGRNIAANPEIVVHLESGDDAVILEGVAEEARDRPFLERFADAYEAKYAIRPDPDSGPVYALRPRKVFAWRERDFPGSATRWTQRT